MRVSTLTEPVTLVNCPGYRNTGDRWRDDVMQLAHYTRMLQELGWHLGAGPNLGGVIGSDDSRPLLDRDLGITWYDPDAETILTYSATEEKHRRKCSPLQRYDHEFGFRVKLAESVRAGGELVRPYRVTDCDGCVWFEYCAAVAGPDGASFAVEAGHLNVREWQFLYAHCGRHGRLSVTELTAAVRRSRMITAGTDLEPRGPVRSPVPVADIEVDLDIEWDTTGRIYQWGPRIRDGQDEAAARYRPVVSFEPLDEHAEITLAETFAARIRELRDRAEREGKSLRIFHWHHPETSRTRKFGAVERVLDGLTLDLRAWFDAAYFARTSSSIKRIAGIVGFHWPVDDPGGLASQNAIDIARGVGPAAEAARRWCLAYNEGVVAAQAAIRDGLRRLPAAGVQACD